LPEFPHIKGISIEQISAAAANAFEQAVRYIAQQVPALTQNVLNLIVQLALAFYILFFLLRDGHQLIRKLISLIPIGDRIEIELFERFTSVARATIKGGLIVAVIQGSIGGLLFWSVGIPAAFLWGLLMIVLSLLPIGSALIWAPAAIILFLHKEKRSEPTKITFSDYRILVTKQGVLIPSLLALLTQHVNWSLTFGFFPTLARDLGANSTQVSSLVPLFFVFYLLGSLTTILLEKKVNEIKIILAAFTVMISGILISFLTTSMNILYIAQILIGFSVGICEPLLMAVSIKKLPSPEKPAALGFFQTIYAVGMFSGPFISGILAGWLGLNAMFLVTAISILILSILCFQKLFISQPTASAIIETNK